jgi:carnitine O-acetyltransferase
MLNKIDLGPSRTAETASGLPEPIELKFEVNDEVKALIQKSESAFDTLVGQHDLHVSFRLPHSMQRSNSIQVLHYEGYGKNYIKKFKASPDAWAQLVKQLAFHKMFNRPGVTYESAQTRKFQLGRTEVIRSASNETKKWAEAMLDPNQTVSQRCLHLTVEYSHLLGHCPFLSVPRRCHSTFAVCSMGS